MKLSNSIILVTIVAFPTVVHAQVLSFFFNILFGGLVDRACQFGLTSLGLAETLDCGCNLDYQGLFQGFAGDVNCTLDESRCLVPPDKFCATGNVGTTLEAGLFTETGITSDIYACFDVDSGLPNGVLSLSDVCFTFIPDGFALGSCSVTIAGEDCMSCTICDSGIDFKFDCANVDILEGDGFIGGPNLTECIGLSLIPSNTTTRLL